MNDLADGRRPHPAWVGLLCIILASIALRGARAATHPSPWILMDELVHAEVAESLAHGGPIGARGEPFPHRAVVYPALIAPAFRLAAPSHAYLVAKLLNALMISLAAIPVFLLARRIVDRRAALVAAALALAIPSMAYASTLMAENAFYPLALTCLLCAVRAIERPSAGRQIVAWAVGIVALFTHAQGVALLATLLLALVTAARTGTGGFAPIGRVRRLAPTLVIATSLILGATAVVVTGHGGTLFGHYERLIHAPVDAAQFALAASNALAEIATLAWTTGVVPAGALAALVVATLAGRASTAARPLVLVFGWAIACAVGSSALWTARLGGTWTLERTTFWVAPAFGIAVAWWSTADRDAARRARLGTIVTVVVGAALPCWLLTRTIFPTYNNLGTSFLARALAMLGGTGGAVLVVGLSVAAAVVLLVPRFARSTPFATALVLVAFHIAAEHRAAGYARDTRWNGIQVDHAWIDDAVPPDADVVAIWCGTTSGQSIWLSEFFNRRVTRVCSCGEQLADDFAQTPLVVTPDGHYVDEAGTPLVGRYVLIDAAHPIAGERIASDPGVGLDLYRVDGPVRVRRGP